jgi:hypothetical protein
MWPSVFRCLERISSWRDIILFFPTVKYEEYSSAVIWILMKDEQDCHSTQSLTWGLQSVNKWKNSQCCQLL